MSGNIELTENVLLIDVDEVFCSSTRRKVAKRIAEVMDLLNVENYTLDFRRSTSGYTHAVVKLYLKRKLSDLEIVLLQALCGSDWKREAFNYMRVLSGIENWNVLFVKKFSKSFKEG